MNCADMVQNHPYLKNQLIAYIGNKRALKQFLFNVFSDLLDAGTGQKVFLDPFAGSGAVSRLAKHMGFQVLANDWEFYSYILNTAHLCCGSTEIKNFYKSYGGINRIFDQLNSLTRPDPDECYISRFYAPHSTLKTDYRRERLFYTRENALVIDAVRSEIEMRYPGFDPDERGKKEKFLLLAALLYQCATHTNTSGVFKAYHRGFGGHGRDALKRITDPIRLEIPLCIDSKYEAKVFRLDAAEFAGRNPGDICYLDPPYNQHQYGSNYHLLNTIALWDKPEVSNELGSDGRLKYKAAIRPDWKKTKSPFCYRISAYEAFQKLLDNIDSRYILLSYNTEGIIPFENLLDALSCQGRVSLFTNDYVKYRGGKQSMGRKVHNVEILLVLDREKKHRKQDFIKIDRLVRLKKLRLLLKQSFYPDKIKSAFKTDKQGIVLNGSTCLILPMSAYYRFTDQATELITKLSEADLECLFSDLLMCECRNKIREIEILIEILKRSSGQADLEVSATDNETAGYRGRIIWLLKKFAHRKYRHEFFETLNCLRSLAVLQQDVFGSLLKGLDDIEKIAGMRFNG